MMNSNIAYKKSMPRQGMGVPENERCKMLHTISMIDFVMVEMALYLDTHPKDPEAIDYFTYYTKLKNKLMKEYCEKYGPLTLDCAEYSEKEWKWALQEPPWKGMGK